MTENTISPTVSVSYTHDSQEHKDRVLALSDQLRADGIDSHIDQYETSPLEGWPQWMQNQIESAQLVLVVCTETYARRFAGKEETGKGKGATWEGGIITRELYESEGRNSKFIPVVFSRADIMFIPSILQGATYYVVGTEDGYIRLYRRLTNQPAVVKPELGRPRSLPPLERHRDFERSSANSAVNLPLQSCAPGADNSIRVLLNTDETAEIFTAERIESAETLRLFLLPSSSKEVSFLRDLRKTRGFIGVTYENRGMHATLKTISSMMEGGRDLWVVELEPFEGDYRGTGLGEMACGNYSADQIAEMRARRILLDEKLPEYLTNEDEILRRLNNATLEAFVQGIGTQVQIKGSLIPILFDAAAGDMPGFLEAARLFSVFALHVSGVVEHVYELDMEMVGESELRVKFEGRRPRTYVNVEPTSIKIEGTCPLRR